MNVVMKVEVESGKVRAFRQIEGAQEVFESDLPAVLTAQKGLNEPRYASLKGIMAAKKKPVEVVGHAELGVAAEEVGKQGARIRWAKLEPPPPRPEGKIIEGEPEEAVPQLVRLLREEAKVI